MYETLSSFAQTWGLLFFVAMFGAAVFYALRPQHQDKFDAAARMPLVDDAQPAAASEQEEQTHG